MRWHIPSSFGWIFWTSVDARHDGRKLMRDGSEKVGGEVVRPLPSMIEISESIDGSE